MRGQSLPPGGSRFRQGDRRAGRSLPSSESWLWRLGGYGVALSRKLGTPPGQEAVVGEGGVWGHSAEKMTRWCLKDDQGFARDLGEKTLRRCSERWGTGGKACECDRASHWKLRT